MDSERLARFLAGEATSAERAEIDAWASTDPAHQAELSRLETAWALTAPSHGWDVDRAWSAVSLRLDQSPEVTGGLAEDVIPIRRSLRIPVRWAIAAAVILAAGAGYWFARPERPVEYATSVGQQRSLTLPDGSQVTLAPASRLEVAKGYGKPNRSLSLTGRAWFLVTHDVARPFRITTATAIIEDLGTEFEVNATGSAVRVAVAAGAVAVHREGAPTLTLGAGDLATVSARAEPMVAHQVPAERFSSWRAGTLDFIDRPLSEVCAELERWYDVRFDFKPEVGAERFNGQLPTGRLDAALETIATALGLSHSQTGRTVALIVKDQR